MTSLRRLAKRERWRDRLDSGDMAWRMFNIGTTTHGFLRATKLKAPWKPRLFEWSDGQRAVCGLRQVNRTACKNVTIPSRHCGCGLYSWATTEDACYWLMFPVMALVDLPGRHERRDETVDLVSGKPMTRVARPSEAVPREFGVVVADRVSLRALFVGGLGDSGADWLAEKHDAPAVNYSPPNAGPRQRAVNFLSALDDNRLGTDDTGTLAARLERLLRDEGEYGGINASVGYNGPIFGLP